MDWNLECLAWSIEKLKLPVTFSVVSLPSIRIQEPLPPQNGPEGPNNGPRYRQLFEETTGFIPGVSILDMLFCEGQGQVVASFASENW